MWMQVFATQYHFEDADDMGQLMEEDNKKAGDPWCPQTDDYSKYLDPKRAQPQWTYRQDCIPRAHFDTFVWSFITVFQIMTGENWNTIMYASMRAGKAWEDTVVPGEFWAAILFFIIILWGQTLFLSLFLSMLISQFEEVTEKVTQEEQRKLEIKKAQKLSMRSSKTPDMIKNEEKVSLTDVGARDEPDSGTSSLPGQPDSHS